MLRNPQDRVISNNKHNNIQTYILVKRKLNQYTDIDGFLPILLFYVFIKEIL